MLCPLTGFIGCLCCWAAISVPKYMVFHYQEGCTYFCFALGIETDLGKLCLSTVCWWIKGRLSQSSSHFNHRSGLLRRINFEYFFKGALHSALTIAATWLISGEPLLHVEVVKILVGGRRFVLNSRRSAINSVFWRASIVFKKFWLVWGVWRFQFAKGRWFAEVFIHFILSLFHFLILLILERGTPTACYLHACL